MNAEKGAAEMGRMFRSISSAVGNSWEDIFLDNARRVSGPLAVRMLNNIGLNEQTTTPFKLFDSGCGAGVVAAEVHRLVKPEVLRQSSILAGDFTQTMVDLTQKRIKQEGWINTEARNVDGQKTGLESASFTHFTMNIGFHIVPDSEAALDEAIRILKPNGHLGFTTWHPLIGWGPDLEDAFKSFPFEAPFGSSHQTTPWGNWGDVNWIRNTLEKKGLKDIKVEPLATLQRSDSAEYFVNHFQMIINWVTSTMWSEELQKEHPPEEVRQLVKEYLEKKYEGKGWDLLWISIISSARVA